MVVKSAGKRPIQHPCKPMMLLRILGVLVALAAAWSNAATLTIVPTGATWKYLDNGSDQGVAWRASTFDDSAWKAGPAELGYGDGGEKTVVIDGPSGASTNYITTYFRHSFTVTDASTLTNVLLRVLRRLEARGGAVACDAQREPADRRRGGADPGAGVAAFRAGRVGRCVLPRPACGERDRRAQRARVRGAWAGARALSRS